jgi:hypothetical protein
MAAAGCELFVGMTPYLPALNRHLPALVNAGDVVDSLRDSADVQSRAA